MNPRVLFSLAGGVMLHLIQISYSCTSATLAV